MILINTYSKHLCLTLLLLGIFFKVEAQFGFVSTGGAKKVSEKGEIAYSIGEVGYVNIKTTGGSMDLGIQQAFQFMVVTSVVDISLFNAVYVYPNPTQGLLYIKNLTQQLIGGNLSIKVYSSNGLELMSKSIKSVSTVIDVNQYTKGLYYISLYDAGRVISNYKFIKL
jgi:hypothetical protein